MASRGQVAPEEIRRAVAQSINKLGIVEAARAFGVSRETLAKVAGGVVVAPGTIALMREQLRRTA
jgi:hypothetical protein